jgi:hypothetical protein
MTQDELFVSLFCDQLSNIAKGIRQMRSWYVFSDKRLGGLEDIFRKDAADFSEYQKMFQV